MTRRDGLERAREAVEADKSVTPAERETNITFAEPDDHAALYTTERGLMRRTLAHPEIHVRYLEVSTGGGDRKTVPPDACLERPVIGVAATLPLGLLKIQLRERETTVHADIVSEEVLQLPRSDGGDES